MYGDHLMESMGGFVWIFLALLIVVLIWVLNTVVVSEKKRRRDQETPIEVLERRFAMGEIDDEVFKRQKDLLEATNNRTPPGS